MGAACYQSKCQLLLAIFLAVVTVCLAPSIAAVMETSLVTGDTIQVIFSSNEKKYEKTCIFAPSMIFLGDTCFPLLSPIVLPASHISWILPIYDGFPNFLQCV